MESCVYRTSGSQTCIRSCREKRPAGTSVLGRTSGSIQNSYGTERSCQKMGSRFAKTIEKLGLSISETGIFREYLDARKGKAVNHCCIYGVFCAEMQISLEEALTHYLYAQTSAIVTNCVKTIPLSQTSGQQLLSGCYGEFDEILKDVMNRSEEDLCLSAPGFDIRGIQHENVVSSRLIYCLSLNLVLVYSRLKRG